ncbi:MAG: hypothetical protein GKR88_11010 [Flavobacteriaceae bacterium]|nr:MAG: hypothetical protein GKR88_11010 [Flavobacteriaceae bacterium]
MKKILITTLFFIIIFSCKIQLNNLNDTELFDGIKFNNVSLRSIMDSKGDVTQMRALFGNDIQQEDNNSGPFIGKDIFNSKFYFHYEDETDTGQDFDLTYIKVKNSSVIVNIRGLSIKIGDDRSKFGSLLFNTRFNGYVFTDQDTGSVSLSFQIDNDTNKVTEIKFTAY